MPANNVLFEDWDVGALPKGDYILNLSLMDGGSLYSATRSITVSSVGIKPGWPVITGDLIAGSAKVADLENDGEIEIIFVDYSGKVYAYDIGANPKSGWPVDLNEQAWSTPAIADVNNDGNLDVIISTVQGHLHALNAEGAELDGWPVLTDSYGGGTPAAADIIKVMNTEDILGRFPESFFDSSGNFNGILVIGQSSPSADVVSASSLMGHLQSTYAINNEGMGTYMVPIPSSASQIDVDVDNLEQDMILIGSPCDNSIIAEALDMTDHCEEYLEAGVGLMKALKTPEGHTYVIITGYDAETRNRVVQEFIGENHYKFKGDTVYVIGEAPEFKDSSGVNYPYTGSRLEVVADMTWDSGHYGNDGLAMFYHDGQRSFAWPRDYGHADHYVSTPAIGDIDGDNALEIVGRSGDNGQNTVTAYEADGRTVPGWPQVIEETDSFQISSPILADLDYDGSKEIIVASLSLDTNARIHVFYGNGTIYPGWPELADEASLVYGSPSVGDLNNDGDLEIVFSTFSNLYVLNTNGEVLEGFPVSPQMFAFEFFTSAAAIVDIDNDKRTELIINGLNALYAYEMDGTLVEGWPVIYQNDGDSFPITGICTPYVDDIDGDGMLDIIQVAEEGKVYALSVSDSSSDATVHWRGHANDNANTGAFNKRLKPKSQLLNKGTVPIDNLSIKIEVLKWETDAWDMQYTFEAPDQQRLELTAPIALDRTWNAIDYIPQEYGDYLINASILKDDQLLILPSGEMTAAWPFSVENARPRAVISSPRTGGVYALGESILFNASESSDPDGHQLTYTWNFGDGDEHSSQDSITSHSYQYAGNYNATLVVDDGMHTDSQTVEFSVLNVTPYVYLISPYDNTEHNNEIPFHCTAYASGYAEITNISLLSARTGGFEALTVVYNTDRLQVNLSGFTNGSYTWNCLACTASDCAMYRYNRTFSVVLSEYCGDGTCNGDETCSSCSQDCGSCPSNDGGGGGGGGGGGSSTIRTKNIPFEGDLYQIQARYKGGQPDITVIQADSVPNLYSSGAVYKYFDIDSDRSIESAEVYFKVSKSWYDQSDSNPRTTSMRRYDGTSWKLLSTVKVGEDTDSYKFKAATNHFSYYAVTASRNAYQLQDTAPPPEPTVTTVIGDSAESDTAAQDTQQAGSAEDLTEANPPAANPQPPKGKEDRTKDDGGLSLWKIIAIALGALIVIGSIPLIVMYLKERNDNETDAGTQVQGKVPLENSVSIQNEAVQTVSSQAQQAPALMLDPMLEKYVQEVKAKGFNRGQVAQALEQAGWHSQTVLQVLEKYYKDNE